MIKFLKKQKPVYEKPVLKIKSTVVPKSYLASFPVWDSKIYTNQTIINA